MTLVACFRFRFVEQRRGQHRQIVLAIAQRRQRNGKHVQPVKQVLAELAFPDGVIERRIGGRDHAHVQLNLALSAQPAHAPVLQHAQQFGLRGDRHIADFVQQHGAVLRQLEASGAALDRSGEGALFMAEQLAFHERIRHGGAVDGDERSGAPRAQRMNRARGQFFSRAALAGDQHRRAAGRHLLHQREHLLHLPRRAHHFAQDAAVAQLAFQAFRVLQQPALIGGAFEQQAQGLRLHRLLQKPERAQIVDRRDGGFQVSERGLHDRQPGRRLAPSTGAAAPSRPCAASSGR